jgi:hypothetical protein
MGAPFVRKNAGPWVPRESVSLGYDAWCRRVCHSAAVLSSFKRQQIHGIKVVRSFHALDP